MEGRHFGTARVDGIERDVTKNGEDRRVELCPRAIAILEAHLTLRESLVRKGHLRHDALFFTRDDRPDGMGQKTREVGDPGATERFGVRHPHLASGKS